MKVCVVSDSHDHVDMPVIMRLAQASDGALTYHGGDADLTLGGHRIFMMNHYPHLARGMACTGEYDAVFCGHFHAAAMERVVTASGGSTPLVNPGTVAGLGGPATMVPGDLADRSLDVHAVRQ